MSFHLNVAFFILLVMIGAIAYRATTPDQRTQAFRAIVATIKRMIDHERKELEPFRTALRARTAWGVVTLALVALNLAIFLRMLSAGGGQGDPATLIGFGASFGPRSSNGEWWRLLTAMFVHRGLLSLIVNMAALFQLGLVLERLLGRFAFSTAYLAAGGFASLADLSAHPTSVSAGASGAVFGLYGLLAALLVAGRVHRSDVTIPLVAIRRWAPIAAVFVLYNAQSLGSGAESAGLATGLLLGIVFAKGVSDRMPPPRRVSLALAGALVIAVAYAIPLRGVADVRPEIQRLVGLEQGTAGAYQAAVERFKRGRMTPEGLADFIDRAIVPELEAADRRIAGLHGVPHQDEGRVADAKKYLRLRSESWRLRAEGLRLANKPVPAFSAAAPSSDVSFRARAETRYRSTLQKLGEAEGAERASLEAFNRLQQ